MQQSEFIKEGFYYNNGKELVKIGQIMESPEGKYYKITLQADTDEVYLQEGNTNAILEPERLFLDNCYPPLDANLIPVFPQL